jgi:hypothetical protein
MGLPGGRFRRRYGFLRRLRRFHADQGGSGKEHCGNQDQGREDAPPAACKSLAEVVLVEQPFDTKGKTSGMSHGNSYLCQARHRREFKQNLRIRRVAGRLFKTGAVTDRLAQV